MSVEEGEDKKEHDTRHRKILPPPDFFYTYALDYKWNWPRLFNYMIQYQQSIAMEGGGVWKVESMLFFRGVQIGNGHQS